MKQMILWIILLILIFSTMPIHSKSDKNGLKQNMLEKQYDFDKTFFCNKTVYNIHKFNFLLCLSESFSFAIDNELHTISDNGLMNSSWPMQSHDMQHTGLSPYNTINNPGVEKWRFKCWEVESSAIIDSDGSIYFGSKDGYLYCFSQNGIFKWKYDAHNPLWSTPAIAEDGTIYVGTWGQGYLHAIFSNGTGKWIFCPYPYTVVDSSITISDDGTIYFGCENGRVYAMNPNGTEKWYYPSGGFVQSTPAIGKNNIIYVGSSDKYLYALYPNGSIYWQYKTGGWIKGNPTIAVDGTIYVPSFDGYLYALYPNGTLRWKATTGDSIAAAGIALSSDGTIYVGTELLRAYYSNGTLKWATDIHGTIYGTTPAVSTDGTIFVSAGFDLIAINSNGTEKWRTTICNLHAYSSPCIGKDGTIYVGSTWQNGPGGFWYGYLHAIGPGEQKRIEIQNPIPGHLYLFGQDKGLARKKNTVVIGSVLVRLQVYSPDEIDSIHFYFDGTDQYNVTVPPFEWNMNRRYGKLFPLQHTITVTAYYKGGCSWSESIPVVYFHLFKHF